MTHLEDSLAVFIRKEFLYDRPDARVDPDSSLIESGVVDSLGILSLIGFLEDQHRIVVPATEVVFENFESIAAIRRMVERLPAGLA
jgi:acyl carrier protein